jgi:uncharacterized protein YpmB
MKRKWLVGIIVVAAVAVATAYVVSEALEKKRKADEATDDIESQLSDLDPITRAAVVARLGADAARGRL